MTYGISLRDAGDWPTKNRTIPLEAQAKTDCVLLAFCILLSSLKLFDSWKKIRSNPEACSCPTWLYPLVFARGSGGNGGGGLPNTKGVSALPPPYIKRPRGRMSDGVGRSDAH